MPSIMKSFAVDEQGSTALEYAVIAMLVSVFIIATVSSVGTELNTMWNKVDTTTSTAISKIE